MDEAAKPAEIIRIKDLLEEANREWDRLDNGSQDVQQQQVANTIEQLSKKLDELKGETS